MATIAAPTITAYQAQAEAGGFLTDHLPDRFCAGRPQFDYETQLWRVPVLLSYPVIGPIGQVGEILVNADDEQHALVVVDMGESVVTVYDPLFGERFLERESFSAAWGLKRNLAILVAR